MDKRIVRSLAVAMLLVTLGLTSQAARAQTALKPTMIIVGAPATAQLGQLVTVQAVRVDSQGHPISKAVVYFTTKAKFLGDGGVVVLAQAVTNSKGQAVAEFTDDSSGTLALQAEFRGDDEYAPSNAAAQVAAAGQQQVYEDHVGVDLPGFNVPPMGAQRAAVGTQRGISGFIAGLWPMMNGWPVFAVLLLVWSLYFFAVTFVFRVARLAGEDAESSSAGSRRAL